MPNLAWIETQRQRAEAKRLGREYAKSKGLGPAPRIINGVSVPATVSPFDPVRYNAAGQNSEVMNLDQYLMQPPDSFRSRGKNTDMYEPDDYDNWGLGILRELARLDPQGFRVSATGDIGATQQYNAAGVLGEAVAGGDRVKLSRIEKLKQKLQKGWAELSPRAATDLRAYLGAAPVGYPGSQAAEFFSPSASGGGASTAGAYGPVERMLFSLAQAGSRAGGRGVAQTATTGVGSEAYDFVKSLVGRPVTTADVERLRQLGLTDLATTVKSYVGRVPDQQLTTAIEDAITKLSGPVTPSTSPGGGGPIPIGQTPPTPPADDGDTVNAGGGLDQARLELDALDLAFRTLFGQAGIGQGLLGQLTGLQQNSFSVVPALQAYAAAGGGPNAAGQALQESGFTGQPSPYGSVVDQLIKYLSDFSTGQLGLVGGPLPPEIVEIGGMLPGETPGEAARRKLAEDQARRAGQPSGATFRSPVRTQAQPARREGVSQSLFPSADRRSRSNLQQALMGSYDPYRRTNSLPTIGGPGFNPSIGGPGFKWFTGVGTTPPVRSPVTTSPFTPYTTTMPTAPAVPTGGTPTQNAARLIGGAFQNSPYIGAEALQRMLTTGGLPGLNEINPAIRSGENPEKLASLYGLFSAAGIPQSIVDWTLNRYRPQSYR